VISKKAMLAMAFALAFIPTLATAAPAKLVLVIGGEAYDGPPKFAVTLNGKVVAEGAVDKAIDTGTDKRFADAADKSQYVESFSFDIPEADFATNGDLRIQLTNEAYGGEGSNRDRNLFISSVSLNGRETKADQLATVTKDGIVPGELVDGYLAINDGNAEAVVPAPKGGWPEATTEAAQSKPTEPEAEPEPPVAEKAPEPAQVKEAAPAAEAKPAEAAKPEEPAKPATPAAEESKPQAAVEEPKPAEPAPVEAVKQPEPAVETAAAKPASDTCALSKSYDITGFGQNSNDLTPATNKILDEIAGDIGEQTCSITLTGYSDTFGSYATNALFSVERAQNALKYLRDKGIKFTKAEATGVGETTKFGPSARANRRVVIAVAP